MRRTALVTGSPDRLKDLVPALEHAGVKVVSVEDMSGLAEVCEGIEPKSIDCYIQLPVETPAEGSSAVERVRNFLEAGLLARFDAVATVLPVLASSAIVVLGAGHHPGSEPLPDDQRARIALLRVLAHAVLAETADSKVIVRVVDHARSAAEIAGIALEEEGAKFRTIVKVSDHRPDLSWDDWRRDIMALGSMES